MWFSLILACSDVPEAGSGPILKSTPIPPTTDLIAKKRATDLEAVKNHPLVAFFPPDVGIPPVLDGLEPNMPSSLAIQLLDSKRAPGLELVKTDGNAETLVGTTLADFPGVGVTLHLTVEGLDSFDVSLPSGVGQDVLLARWGEPPTTLRDELDNVDVFMWASHESGMAVQLHKPEKGKQVAQFKWVEGIKK